MLDKNDHVDHQRWLIENGFINDLHKDNLYMYGALCHKDINAVEVRIDINNKVVEYDLYMSKSLFKKVRSYIQLSKSDTIFELWKLKRLIKNNGNLNFSLILSNFVRDYLGPKWRTVANYKDIADYEEGFKQQAEADAKPDKSDNSG